MASLLFGVSATDALTFSAVPVILAADCAARQLSSGAARDAGGSGGRAAKRIAVDDGRLAAAYDRPHEACPFRGTDADRRRRDGGNRRCRAGVESAAGAVGWRARRTPGDSVRQPANDRSRREAESIAGAKRPIVSTPRTDRSSDVGARRPRRAGGVAAARVFEDRRTARLHEPAQPSCALLQRVGRGRLRAWSAAHRNRVPRSATGGDLLHGGSKRPPPRCLFVPGVA